MRNTKINTAFLTAALSFVLVSCAVAAPVMGGGSSKFQVGIQSSWPSYGISGKMDVSKDITVQAVAAFGGSIQTSSGRVLYTFKKQDQLKFYGFGGVGIYTAAVWGYRESVLGFSAGAGAEMPVSKEMPIRVSLEAGLQVASFETVAASVGSIGLGLGIHYRL